MAWTIYNRGKFTIAKIDMSTADLRMLVVAGASVPAGAINPDLNFVSELLAVSGVVEAAAVGYARIDLAAVTLAEDDVNDWAAITWTAPSWSNVASGETWRAIAVYVEGASDAARPLVGIDTVSALPTNGSNITYSGASIRVT